MDGPWGVASAVAAGLLVLASTWASAVASRSSKRLPPYDALAERLDGAYERLDKQDARINALQAENEKLKTALLEDHRREHALEDTVAALRALIRDVLDGVRVILRDFGDNPEARDRLEHLLEAHEPTMSRLGVYQLEETEVRENGHREPR